LAVIYVRLNVADALRRLRTSRYDDDALNFAVGRYVSFIREQNLVVYDLASSKKSI